MTWASMSRALSHRARQKPSRPASKATAMRLIRCPAFAASSRHRCSNFSNALSSTASFFNGWRSTPGTMPATSQLDRLSSITAISVPSGSRGLGDRLRSFNFCMGRSIGSHQQRWMQYPRRRPIASPLEVCVRRPTVRAAPPSWGRHPQTFTRAAVRLNYHSLVDEVAERERKRERERERERACIAIARHPVLAVQEDQDTERCRFRSLFHDQARCGTWGPLAIGARRAAFRLISPSPQGDFESKHYRCDRDGTHNGGYRGGSGPGGATSYTLAGAGQFRLRQIASAATAV